jgi:hypothetical protein
MDNSISFEVDRKKKIKITLQKGGVPATPSGTATLLRLSPNYLFYPNWRFDNQL